MGHKIYRIGDSHESGTINLITNKKRYKEAEFWEEFDKSTKEIFQNHPSENEDELLLKTKELLNSGHQVTIKNRCFEITTK